jgi:hypothetical protein
VLCLGSNRQQARMIYAGGSGFSAHGGPAGNTLLFFDGTALMAGRAGYCAAAAANYALGAGGCGVGWR